MKGNIVIRKADSSDLPQVNAIYEHIHCAEENGLLTTGWIRNVYPVPATARQAQARDELFVLLQAGVLKGAAIINPEQHESYGSGKWQYAADPDSIMVMHTLAIDPAYLGQGLGRAFLEYYAAYALEHGCPVLRLDTNAKNLLARKFYKKFGFLEAGIAGTTFNGIGNVELVLLENLAKDVQNI